MQNANDNEVIEVQARQLDAKELSDLKLLGWISYGMHLVVAICAVLPGLQPSLLLLLLALILDVVKSPDARGSWQQSHFEWRIRSVGWSLFWYVLTWPLFLLLYIPGLVAWFFVSLWFLVRIVRGMVAMNQNRAITTA
ncbi:DUF4870 family protein [Vandammella animalimorsus]|uniref:Transmembrane protein n=1 Tax=Vandammella animalimorsus TaxID=2029117 RepID=A0A2A2AA32_9BURK|nr:hypothetical protein [Vandammella animalimorsus]PAT34574.1 hypothetical protein CK620_06630 [Vandammella animalimorsus]